MIFSESHSEKRSSLQTNCLPHRGGRLSGECIVTGMLKNKITDGMTV